MREYNDYVQATREYLRNYHEFKATIANINDEIEMQERLLGLDPQAPIPKYGDDTGGGSSELTATEAAAAKRVNIRESIINKRQEVERIELVLRKVDRAMNALTGQEKQLLDGFYFKHRTWKQLSIEHFMTEKWARMTAKKALKRMAGMIFGNAPEQQKLFVFFE